MMCSLDVSTTPLSGLWQVQRRRLTDPRGYFSRFFCANEMAELGWARPVAQINHTRTERVGAVRGLHFQHPPHDEDKFVSCLHGAVFDVAVDLRRGSPTFLRWYGATLTAANGCSLLIPRGFAHGFQVLEPGSELLYLHSAPFVSAAEGALHAMEARVAIDWPLPVSDLSQRDAAHPPLSEDFFGLEVSA